MGHHWIEGTLFILYLIYVAVYTYSRPINGEYETWSTSELIGEIVLWIMNYGYIVYELNEIKERGYRYVFA